ncbi:hypothetical protein C8J56DRAFT_824592 [Mycena floridula]|nr:hypothetical protein C8J56DRAFT_824592 [Mycena floridula]
MDDLTFGASVWGSSDPVVLSPPKTSSDFLDDSAEFDDFDDFGTAQTESSEMRDDDFGDFGDFGDVEQFSTPAEFQQELSAFAEEMPIAGPSSWRPLQLDPLPSRSELIDDVSEILEPIWMQHDVSNYTTDDPIREVTGVSHVLVAPESRNLYKMLIQSPPPTKPPNWTRSRIRRQHLISLGIPVNLDEVLPHANGKPLPPLNIITRPSSAPPGPRQSQSNSRAGSPHPNSRGPQFGPKPELNIARINELLELETDTLVLQSLPTLEKYLAEFRAQTANTSALLTHLLQSKDALQQDSETYNGLIAELVGEAQKIKTGKIRTPVTRRGSGLA